jgi:hypothetical protein
MYYYIPKISYVLRRCITKVLAALASPETPVDDPRADNLASSIRRDSLFWEAPSQSSAFTTAIAAASASTTVIVAASAATTAITAATAAIQQAQDSERPAKRARERPRGLKTTGSSRLTKKQLKIYPVY